LASVFTVAEHSATLDAILDHRKPQLGGDYTAYRNHCYRVLNFCLAFGNDSDVELSKSEIAAAFHDLGIWTEKTYDYLEPSSQLARAYLAEHDLGAWSEEIVCMIANHHKITRFKAHPDWLVEAFRRADWVDVSRGRFKFGLPAIFVTAVMARFPNAGFHRRLVALSKQRFKTHPLSPLPMMRL
ncbi:MAG TPA: HD domain-containing protein, partial [Gallionellaceae bacterium]